ncbi:DUF1045 domain-containing protein [Pararhodobacter sp.]|uniref:DUF1045 domain-containing protein n=1 Tax=Pararhodobacter sp. TaxID=2127056 RepID=UPI002D1FA6EB|nr:DUF1045 domain-containing protein [Pararhodobacter sp.]
MLGQGAAMKRYALYFAPPPGPLARAGAQWLGRDAVTGQSLAQPDPGLPALTASARRYGFHATLKAPFALAEGTDEEALLAAVDAFAAGVAPFAIGGLRVDLLGRFLALTPIGDTGPLRDFAAQVVRRFDRFRAPLTDRDRARRHPDSLPPRQRAQLDRWGYPWIFDDFRFHLTLSDPLTEAQQTRFRPMAEDLFAPLLPQPFVMDALCVFGEGVEGDFRHLHRAPLG